MILWRLGSAPNAMLGFDRESLCEEVQGLLTTSLTGHEWLACIGLAALLPLVIETGKWKRRRTLADGANPTPRPVVAPGLGPSGSSETKPSSSDVA